MIEIDDFISKTSVKNKRNAEKRGREKKNGEVRKREEKSSFKLWCRTSGKKL